MNVLLFLILLVVGEGAYFEYAQQQQIEDGIQIQMTDAQAIVNGLEADNRELTKARKDILQQTTALESSIEKSSESISPASSVVAVANRKNVPGPTPPPSPDQINSNLGTITTTDGRTFQNCQLLKIEPDGITFNHADGITKVLYPFLPPEMQKKFGFDPQADAARQAAQDRYEHQLQAAGVSGASQTAAQ